MIASRRTINVKTILVLVAMSGWTAYGNEGGPPRTARILLARSPSHVQAGQRFTVDVLVDDVTDLQAFQVTLVAEGGDRGSLILEEVAINETEDRHAFRGKSILAVGNVKTAEAAGVHLSASVNVDSPALLATFHFRASLHAAGIFTIKSAGPDRTFLRDSDAVAIPCRADTVTQVHVLKREKKSRASPR